MVYICGNYSGQVSERLIAHIAKYTLTVCSKIERSEIMYSTEKIVNT